MGGEVDITNGDKHPNSRVPNVVDFTLAKFRRSQSSDQWTRCIWPSTALPRET